MPNIDDIKAKIGVFVQEKLCYISADICKDNLQIFNAVNIEKNVKK
jgi:hypothetical protein